MAQVARAQQQPPFDMDATTNNADETRRFQPPPGIHPNSAVFGAMNLPKPLTWQRREHLLQRRVILGRIGQLLLRNAQLVLSGHATGNPAAAVAPAAATAEQTNETHNKTWALARKLEVLLFLNSASLLEYNNVDSLARRVQAMTASIVNKKIRREIVTQSHPTTAPPATSRSHQASARIQAAPAPAMSAIPSMPVAAPLVAVAATQQQQTFTEMMHSTMVPPRSIPAAAMQPPQPTLMPVALPLPLPRLGHVVAPGGGGKRSASEMLAATRGQDAGPVATVAMDMLPSPLAKRARLVPAKLPHQLPYQMIATAPPTTPSASATVSFASPGNDGRLGQMLFRGFEELNKIVWSYVDGVQLMRSRAVCRAARVLAPLFVTSLQLSCNATQMALNTFCLKSGACILRECVNLRQLEVVSLSSGMTFGKLSMRAMHCPQRFVVTHDDHEQIVLALSQQLRLNAFPRLTRLGLTCLFTNEQADGEADVLLNNLMTGCCPQLEELCLPGNSFGDYGAMKIAQMLRARVCPKLTRLDLRRNFISEEGFRSVCHALADGCAPQLVELCLGGNTITDSCFHHVLFAMESRQLNNLRFLGIEMNYLTATSMEMLGRTIGKLVCPQLSQISYSDNSVDNAEAKRVIATAVYQERMFRLRQQQLRHQQRQSGRRDGSSQNQNQSQSVVAPQWQQFPRATTGSIGAGSAGFVATATHQSTTFPYEFQPSSASNSLRAANGGGATGGGASYFLEGNYSSADDDDDDDEPYSSDGE